MNLLSFICLLFLVVSVQAVLRWRNHNQKPDNDCNGCTEGKICIEERCGGRYCHNVPTRTTLSCVEKSSFPIQCEDSQRIACTKNKKNCECSRW